VRHVISTGKLNSILGEKVLKQVEKAIHKQLGDAVWVDLGSAQDTDAGNLGHDDALSFWLELNVTDIDYLDLLQRKKGAAFAGNFSMLLDSLRVLQINGVGSIDKVLAKTYATIDAMVSEKLDVNLQGTLQEKLGAEVQSVDNDTYQELQERAARFRCCVDRASGTDRFWWLFEDVLHRGSCPKIDAERECVPKRVHGLVVVPTSFVPYTDCFIYGDGQDLQPLRFHAISAQHCV